MDGENVEEMVLSEGASVYRGVIANFEELQVETTSLPDKEDEDGGVSFTLDPNSTPKCKSNRPIFEFRIKKDLHAIVCEKKLEFRERLGSSKEKACFTEAEKELKLKAEDIPLFLEIIRIHKNLDSFNESKGSSDEDSWGAEWGSDDDENKDQN